MAQPCSLVFVDGLFRSGTSFTVRLLNSFPGVFLVSDGMRIATEALTDIGHLRTDIREYPLGMFDGRRLDFRTPIRDRKAFAARAQDEIRRIRDSIQSPFPAALAERMLASAAAARDTAGLTYEAFYRGLFAAMAGDTGAGVVGTKTTNQMPYLTAYLDAFPEARWIAIVRDPRGNYLSQIGEHRLSPTQFALCWNAHARHTLAAAADPRYRERLLVLRYEDLMCRPAEQTGRLARFLGVALDVEAHLAGLAFTRADGKPWHQNTSFPGSISVAGDGWQQSDQKIYEYFDTRPVSRWKSALSAAQQRTINCLCARGLRALGYDAPTYAAPQRLRARLGGWSVTARRRTVELLPVGVRRTLRRMRPAVAGRLS